MSDMEKINEQELEDIAGGKKLHKKSHESNERTVAHLARGYLAMRTAPTYDYGNEIKGAELYNGNRVYIAGDYVHGGDGKTYVWVYSPKSQTYGYVNSGYLTY